MDVAGCGTGCVALAVDGGAGFFAFLPSIRAELMSPHISCRHDAVARARVTDRGLFDPEIRPFISMRYT